MKRLWVVPLLCSLLSACTTTTGTRVQLAPGGLRDIHTLGVVVSASEPFSVRNATEKQDNTTAVMFGFIGASIEAGVRSSNDAQAAKRLEPALHGWEIRTELAKAVRDQLSGTGLFTEIRGLDSADHRAARAAGLDAILTINVTQWGLVVCDKNSGSTRMQTVISSEQTLVALRGDRTLWARGDARFNGECHAAAEYETQPNLLSDVLQRATAEIATRLASEIRYPRAAAESGAR